MEDMLKKLRSRHSRNTVCLPNYLLDTLPAREADEEDAPEQDASALLRWCRRKWGALLSASDRDIADRYLRDEKIHAIADSCGLTACETAHRIASATMLLSHYRKASPPVRLRRVANLLERIANCVMAEENCSECRYGSITEDSLAMDLLRFASARFIIPVRDAQFIEGWLQILRDNGCALLTEDQRLRLCNALMRTSAAVKGREGFRNSYLANPIRVRRLLAADSKEITRLAEALLYAEAGSSS